MPPRREPDKPLKSALLCILGAIVLVDCVWATLRDFDLAAGSYLAIAALSAALLLLSWFYGAVRRDPKLCAMLFGAGFLCAFSAAFSVLNYFLLTVAGTRIDALLASVDRSLGFDWPTLVAAAAAHPRASLVLALAYQSILPQIAFLVVCLGWFGSWRRVYSFCLAFALSAAMTVGFWTAFPSFGALAVYDMDPAIAERARLVVGAPYVRDLIHLLAEGPGRIAPDQVKGLIAFPSFHAVLAVLVAWYARRLPFVSGLALALNAAVLVATPVHGGHFVIDIAAGIAVALATIALVARLERLASTAGRSRPVPASGLPIPSQLRAVQPTGT